MNSKIQIINENWFRQQIIQKGNNLTCPFDRNEFGIILKVVQLYMLQLQALFLECLDLSNNKISAVQHDCLCKKAKCLLQMH